MKFPHSRILLFCRAPVAGEVKTRLIPRLGREGATQLHIAMLVSKVELLLGAHLCPVEIWVAPDCDHPFFDRWRGLPQVRLRTQAEGDLGQKMGLAAAEALAAANSVLLIGSDCPAMDLDYLRSALARLAAGDEAVLGPAEDGGYVLLGLTRCHLRLFQQIDWGTDAVSDATRNRLAELDWRWSELEPLWDVDREADLERLERIGFRVLDSEPG